MNILVIIPSYKPAYVYGGPIYSVATLCEALQREKNCVSVLTTNANGKKDLAVKTGKPCEVNEVEVIFFKRWTGDHSNFTPSLLWACWKAIKKYDVVHLHSWWNMVIIPVMIMCWLRGVKPVLSPRGSITQYTLKESHSRLKRVFHFMLGERLLKQCFFHVTSDQEKEDISGLITGQKIYVVPNLLELPRPTNQVKPPSEKFRLVYMGRIHPKKNLELLLNTLLDQFPLPFSLEIIGDGDIEYIEQLKKQTSGRSQVNWLGPIHSIKKWEHLANADLMVLPSYNENYANVVLESLSQGTPVLISDQVGLKDYVLANQFGWVAENKERVWKDQLITIWKDRETRNKIRSRAPEKIQIDFCIRDTLKPYLAMYKDVAIANGHSIKQ